MAEEDRPVGEPGEEPETPQLAGAQHDALATLKAWRDRGARRVDPLRYDFLEALARRTASCEGAARPLLDDKLGKAMLRLRESCEQAGCVLDGDADDTPQQPARRTKVAAPAPGALAQLLAQLEASRQGQGEHAVDASPPQIAPAAIASGAPVAPAASAAPSRGQTRKSELAPAPAAPAAPPQRIGEAQEALTYFRRTWTRLDARRRLAQSQANLPANAGPLNSQQLVHRALTLMQGAAPGYLHQLMAYVDALSALEPFQPAAAAAAPAEAARGDARGGSAVKKAGRGKRG